MTDHPTATDREAVVLVPPVDTLEVDDGLLVLYERTVVRLTVLGRAVIDLCSRPTTEAALAAGLVREFGDPPDGDLLAATRTVVEELLAGGVLRREGPRCERTDR